jgi:hypothetical protein
MVHLAQTVHLSCTNTNNISKQTKTRFHKTHVTEQFHRVRPKQFLSIWYFRHKLCTNLVSRLALSSNRMKRSFSRASSPRSTFGCVQNNFWACGTVGINRVAPTLTPSPNGLKRDSRWPTSPRSSSVLSKTTYKPMARSAQTEQLSCVKITTISKWTGKFPVEAII